jgi:hypothetical protein
MEKYVTIVLLSYFFVLLLSTKFILVLSQEDGMCNATSKSCDELLPGQYRCEETLKVDPDTQSVVGCKESHTVEGILFTHTVHQPQNQFHTYLKNSIPIFKYFGDFAMITAKQ